MSECTLPPRVAPPGRWASLLLVGATALLVALPTLGGDFLADDFAYVRLGPRPLADFLRFGDLTEEAWGGNRPLDEPRPLFGLTYKLDAVLFGAANPVGLHATNIALHVASSLAVVLLAELLVAAPAWTPLLAGLLFAVAPAHAEPIAWVTGRVDSLSTLLFVAAFIFYLRHDRDGRARDRWLALVALALGLLAKETMATLPLVLLLWEALRATGALPRERLARFLRRARNLVPLLLAVGLYAGLRLLSFGSFAREERLSLARGLEFLDRQLYYVKYLIVPFPDILDGSGADLASKLLAGAVLAVFAAGALALVRRREALRQVLFFGFVFQAVTILPLLMTYRSARHLYLPSVGFAIATAFLLLPPLTRPSRWRLTAAAFLVAIFARQLLVLEGPWLAAEDVSRRVRAGVFALTQDLSPDAIVLLPDVPLSKDGVLGWEYALPFALQPPFVARDVAASVRLLEHPGLYCCPARAWWQARRPILLGLVADEAGGARELVLLTWNPGRKAVVRHRARLAPAEIRRVIEEALGTSLEAAGEIDTREGARIVRALALAVRHSS